MPFLAKADFKTHLYAEVIDNITRADDTVLDKAISAGIAEVKMYLSRYDLLALFGTALVDPTVEATKLEHLKNLTKDVASWHLVKLANPNVDLKLFRTLYEDAIKLLEKIMNGKAQPEGWPFKADDPLTEGFNENAFVQAFSNTKRTQHF
jgi:phage gp36-like protein